MVADLDLHGKIRTLSLLSENYSIILTGSLYYESVPNEDIATMKRSVRLVRFLQLKGAPRSKAWVGGNKCLPLALYLPCVQIGGVPLLYLREQYHEQFQELRHIRQHLGESRLPSWERSKIMSSLSLDERTMKHLWTAVCLDYRTSSTGNVFPLAFVSYMESKGLVDKSVKGGSYSVNMDVIDWNLFATHAQRLVPGSHQDEWTAFKCRKRCLQDSSGVDWAPWADISLLCQKANWDRLIDANKQGLRIELEQPIELPLIVRFRMRCIARYEFHSTFSKSLKWSSAGRIRSVLKKVPWREKLPDCAERVISLLRAEISEVQLFDCEERLWDSRCIRSIALLSMLHVVEHDIVKMGINEAAFAEWGQLPVWDAKNLQRSLSFVDLALVSDTDIEGKEVLEEDERVDLEQQLDEMKLQDYAPTTSTTSTTYSKEQQPHSGIARSGNEPLKLTLLESGNRTKWKMNIKCKLDEKSYSVKRTTPPPRGPLDNQLTDQPHCRDMDEISGVAEDARTSAQGPQLNRARQRKHGEGSTDLFDPYKKNTH